MSVAIAQPDAPQPPSIAEQAPSDADMAALEREALASMSEEAPAGKTQADDSAPDPKGKQQQQQDKQPPTDGADPSKAKEKKSDPKPDPKGKDGQQPDPKKADEPRNPEDIKDDPKDSAYRRAMKDLQRMGLTWDRLNERKATLDTGETELKGQRTALEQERKAFNDMLDGLASGAIPDAEIRGKKYSADLIRQHMAEKFADGDTEEANAALDLLIGQAQKGAAAAALRPAAEQVQAYNRDAELACAKRPELLDMNAPVSRALKIMLAQPDVLALFTRRPGGFQNAVELADILAIGMEGKATADKLGEAQAENGRLKARIAELEALTSPGDGDLGKGPTLSEEEQFDRMTPEQQEAFFRRQYQPG